jgi:hypothetical protein
MSAAAQDLVDRNFLAGVRSIDVTTTHAGVKCTASQIRPEKHARRSMLFRLPT